MSKLDGEPLKKALDKGVTRKVRTLADAHDDEFDERCVVCTHAGRVQIEALFHGWASYKKLEALSGIGKDALEAHMLALDLVIKRSHNTDGAMSRLMEAGMARAETLEIEVKDLMAIMKHRDRLNKRVDSNNNGDRPTVIVIQGVPGRAQLMQTEEEAAIESKEVRVLGPGGLPRE